MSQFFPDSAALRTFARQLAPTLPPRTLLALEGELGAGKTTFAQGLAEGLGTHQPVTSPTFSLLHEHRDGRLPLFHFDFYRLTHSGEVEALGWDDYLDEDAIILVEWASRFPALLPPARTRALRLHHHPQGRLLEDLPTWPPRTP